eukprot:TRINITY_DN10640_c0_g1_i1.p7 TRINITY_DN10640_c0_g1~~TRINITY_DN10640_c0_g1_i1.p7  ORF type:complete len:153 (+),score=18.25 TRINITY_DN10640_c0_g1_i1:82-540(+)
MSFVGFLYHLFLFLFFFLMIRRPPRSTHCISSAASDVYKRQYQRRVHGSFELVDICNQLIGRTLVFTDFVKIVSPFLFQLVERIHILRLLNQIIGVENKHPRQKQPDNNQRFKLFQIFHWSLFKFRTIIASFSIQDKDKCFCNLHHQSLNKL